MKFWYTITHWAKRSLIFSVIILWFFVRYFSTCTTIHGISFGAKNLKKSIIIRDLLFKRNLLSLGQWSLEKRNISYTQYKRNWLNFGGCWRSDFWIFQKNSSIDLLSKSWKASYFYFFWIGEIANLSTVYSGRFLIVF